MGKRKDFRTIELSDINGIEPLHVYVSGLKYEGTDGHGTYYWRGVVSKDSITYECFKGITHGWESYCDQNIVKNKILNSKNIEKFNKKVRSIIDD